MIIVIYGPPASGKTFHAERFRKFYGCRRVLNWGNEDGDPAPRSGDLVLTNQPPETIRQGLRGQALRIISIRDARQAIGEKAVYP